MAIGHLPEESDAYRSARNDLQEAEKELRAQRERVAELRRNLPADTVIDDVPFQELRVGRVHAVNLSDLFDDPAKPLILMHFMFGKKQQQPCPMCTMWADGYDGVVPHLTQRVNFGVLVAGDVAEFGEYGSNRGWHHLRLLSAASSDLKQRLGFEADDGGQLPGVSVFTRREDGAVVHFYSQSALMGDDKFRGMDLLSPVWHFFDLTPEGRGDWFPKTAYA